MTRGFVCLLAGIFLLTGCLKKDEVEPARAPQRLITILQTNDIHGGVEPTERDGGTLGGMAILGGVVSSIRQGLEKHHGKDAGVLLLDGGDQFQGTLLSNFNEGQLVFAAMNAVGYDAVVPGNHDYDFGPLGWLEDLVTPATEDQDPRGALRRLARQARFPLLSANTYYRDSLKDIAGAKVTVNHVRCQPVEKDVILDFAAGKRPDFLAPYVIREVAGVRVALIGLDHAETPRTTAIGNVSDLCFRDEKEAYLAARRELEGQADVFVLIIHNGNNDNDNGLSKIVEALVDVKGEPLVDAVVAGHTHAINNLSIAGVPIVQSGANGKLFGRIDLLWDAEKKKVERAKVKRFAGLELWYAQCAKGAGDFCKADPETDLLQYEGISTSIDQGIAERIAFAKSEVELISKKKLGKASGKIYVDRISESPLANALTDNLRALAGVEVSLMNTGGMRTAIKAGEVTYEDLFSVLPFNNRAVMLESFSVANLIALLERSVETCGLYGALMQSGLRVTFERNCKKGMTTDPKARLLRVETSAGELLFDETGLKAPERRFTVVTLDYLAAGGSGYEGFKGAIIKEDLGIARELLVRHMNETLAGEFVFSQKVDGRWKEVKPQDGEAD